MFASNRIATISAVAQSLILVICFSVAYANDEPRAAISEDDTEAVIQTKSTTYYFNNNSARMCYTFSLPGIWQPSETQGLSFLTREDPDFEIKQRDKGSRGFRLWSGDVGAVWLYSPEDLVMYKGDDPISKAANSIVTFSEHAFDDFKAMGVELVPYDSSWPDAKMLRITCTIKAIDDDVAVDSEIIKVLVEVAPGWVAQLSASDDKIFHSILETLSITSTPDCYWPQFFEIMEK